jgi:putative transposase
LKARVLDKAYKNEHDARVKERILLIIRVSPDKQHIESVASELHRSRAWAYKWYKRYKDEGIKGLRDRSRSGKPSMLSSETTDKIIQELSNSNTGWDFRQVMDLIQQKAGVRYHEVHIRRLLHKWGFSSKVPQKRFVRTASQKEKNSFKKSTKYIYQP